MKTMWDTAGGWFGPEFEHYVAAQNGPGFSANDYANAQNLAEGYAPNPVQGFTLNGMPAYIDASGRITIYKEVPTIATGSADMPAKTTPQEYDAAEVEAIVKLLGVRHSQNQAGAITDLIRVLVSNGTITASQVKRTLGKAE